MKSLLFFLQIITGTILIIAILLHSAKGEGLGGIGGSAKLFGTPKGIEQGLDRITWTLAIAFLTISLILAMVK